MLRRKIDSFLQEWKQDSNHKPLIVKGARQIGKTMSIEAFGRKCYKHMVSVNFVLDEKYRQIFRDGYRVDDIIRNITLLNPEVELEPGETLIFFDELQQQPAAATSLKSFAIDGRYDIICSGSLMGLNYNEIESNSVGYKQDYQMHSLDFEEFLWALGYKDSMIEDMYRHMIEVLPFSELEMNVLMGHFYDYVVTGGMPAVVDRFVTQRNFAGILDMQQQLLADYEEDITKYAIGVDKGRVKNIYRHIPVFLGRENKKFQISKVAKGARSRDYAGCVEWLADAGIVNICYCMSMPELPLRGNYDPSHYKVYFKDTGLLIASLDDESQQDLRANRNFGTYKGAVFENIIADMLVKQGYELFFYKNEKGTLEMDFMLRDSQSLVPIEVKAKDGATASLRNLVHSDNYPDVRYGIKLAAKNIGFENGFYTFPYFLTFMMKRFLSSPH